MENGDYFNPTGYDIVNTLDTYDGMCRFKVLNNNSSHYLFVEVYMDEKGDYSPTKVLLIESYPYFQEGGPTAYEAWLAAMSQMYLTTTHVSRELEANVQNN